MDEEVAFVKPVLWFYGVAPPRLLRVADRAEEATLGHLGLEGLLRRRQRGARVAQL